MLYSRISSNQKLRKFLEKIRMVFGEINPQLHRFWQSIKSSKEHRKKSWSNTLVCRVLQGIWFHTKRKDGANTSSLWSPKRNCHSQGLLTGWRHRLLWHYYGFLQPPLAQYLFIICPDYILEMLIDLMNLIKENSFTLKKARSRWYPAETIMDADYADYIELLAITPTFAESLLYSPEQAAGGIGLHVYADKTEYMCFNQEGDISIVDGGSLKLVDKFTSVAASHLLKVTSIVMSLKAKQELHKIATSYIEQILKTTLHKMTTVWPLTLYL